MTRQAWERVDKRLATGYWPWSLLAQPAPLPQRLLSAAPPAVVENALGGWPSSEALVVKGGGGSIDVTAKARAHRLDRGLGAEQRHGMDHLET
jgi:hypothetical protein